MEKFSIGTLSLIDGKWVFTHLVYVNGSEHLASELASQRKKHSVRIAYKEVFEDGTTGIVRWYVYR